MVDATPAVKEGVARAQIAAAISRLSLNKYLTLFNVPSNLCTTYRLRNAFMSELHTPKFYVAHIAAATGVSANTIRQWYKRGVLSLGKTDSDADYLGLARTFSGATALTIAIMGEMIKLGLPPNLAAGAGLSFSQNGGDTRLPGHLFSDGQTLLVAWHDSFNILNVNSETKLSLVMGLVPAGAVLALIELDELVDRVRVKLGLGRDPLQMPEKGLKATKAVAAKKSRPEKAEA